MQQQEES